MPYAAVVENGVVVRVIVTDAHTDLALFNAIPCPDTTLPGDTYTAGSFVPAVRASSTEGGTD